MKCIIFYYRSVYLLLDQDWRFPWLYPVWSVWDNTVHCAAYWYNNRCGFWVFHHCKHITGENLTFSKILKDSKPHPKGCCLCWLHALAVVTLAGDVPGQHPPSHLPCPGHVHHPRATLPSEYEPLLCISSNTVFGVHSTYFSRCYWLCMACHQVTIRYSWLVIR